MSNQSMQLIVFRNYSNLKKPMYAWVNQYVEHLVVEELSSAAISDANKLAEEIAVKKAKEIELTSAELDFTVEGAIMNALRPLGFKFDFENVIETEFSSHKQTETLLEIKLLHVGFPSTRLIDNQLALDLPDAIVVIDVETMSWKATKKDSWKSKNELTGAGSFEDLVKYLEAFIPF